MRPLAASHHRRLSSADNPTSLTAVQAEAGGSASAAQHDFAAINVLPSTGRQVQRAPEGDDNGSWWDSIMAAVSGIGGASGAQQSPAKSWRDVPQVLDVLPLDRPGGVNGPLVPDPLGVWAGVGDLGHVAPYQDQESRTTTRKDGSWAHADRDPITGERLTESEHVLAKGHLEAVTYDPTLGQSDYGQAQYRGDDTMWWERDAALEKTHANRSTGGGSGAAADNARTRMFDQRLDNGGSVNYRDEVFLHDLANTEAVQARTGSGSTPEAARRAALGQDSNLFDLWGTGEVKQRLDEFWGRHSDKAAATAAMTEDPTFDWNKNIDDAFDAYTKGDAPAPTSASPNEGVVSNERVNQAAADKYADVASRFDLDAADPARVWNEHPDGTRVELPAEAGGTPSALAAEPTAGAPASGANYGHAALMGGLGAGGLSLLGSLASDRPMTSQDLEKAGMAAGTGALAGTATEALATRFGGGMAGNLKGGAIVDAVTSGAFSTWDNAERFRSGQESGSQATSNVAVDTAVGVGTGLASMWAGGAAGAEIGALAGSVVPGLGNLIGGGAGFLIGAGTGYLGNKLMEASGAKDWLKEEGAALLDATGAGETLNDAWGGISKGTHWLGEEASEAWGGIKDAGSAVGDAASSAWDWLTG